MKTESLSFFQEQTNEGLLFRYSPQTGTRLLYIYSYLR